MKTPEQIEKINAERLRALNMLKDAAEIFHQTECGLGQLHVFDCIRELKEDGCLEY